MAKPRRRRSLTSRACSLQNICGMTNSGPLWTCSAAALLRLYVDGRASPVEVLRACLARADEVDPRLNALITRDREGAERQAAASEARWRAGAALGPLDGVPLTVKDNIPVAALRSTWGSRLYADHVPERDETPVLRLREAGAVIMGKTNVPEMTLQGYTTNPLFGVTRNPWNLELTPGGSSGGAVAAVAAGIGPLALCTDGGGSIRRPASHAGLVGLKPTWGRVPRQDGFPPILLDFEVIGPVARSVADLAAMLETISQSDPAAAAESGFGPIRAIKGAPGGLRILYAPTFSGAPVDPEVARSVAEAARNLEALGHIVEEVQDFTSADAINAAWPVIAQTGIAWLASDPARLAALGPDIRAMAEAGGKLSAAAYFDALHTAMMLRQDLSRLFRRHDLILTPTAAALPWAAELSHPSRIAGVEVGPRGSAIFTGFVNAAGLPAISIPGPASPEGLPIGFQLVAPWGGDETLVGIAGAYEAAYPWPMIWDRKERIA